MNAEPTTHSATRRPADRALMMVTVVSGTILAASCPFLNMGMAGTIAAMVLLLMPYGMLMWRLVRHAGSKEGPGLAIGMGLFVTMAGSLIGVNIRDSNSVIRGANFGEQLFGSGIVATHILLSALGVGAFRRGTSKKPSLRVLVRSIVDPFVYFGVVVGILLFLELAGSPDL